MIIPDHCKGYSEVLEWDPGDEDKRAMTMTQLALGISLRDDATFANYYTQANLACVSSLQAITSGVGDASVYLSGVEGAGKTHLLQAACHHAQLLGRTIAYVPMTDKEWYTSAVLEDLERRDLICIDDLDAIAGDRVWEVAFFDLYNRVKQAGKHIIFSASTQLQSSCFQLMDLRSRLAWGLVYHLSPLNDEEKLAALQLRARNRGLILSADVMHFLMNRYSRHMTDLFRALDKLDKASLMMQRRVTIPFVKEILKI